jgi:nicotinate-nucleotide pyrophosphorylase (carboxylating)
MVALALSEDLGSLGDLSSNAVVPEKAVASARVIARAPGVVSGIAAAMHAFRRMDPQLELVSGLADGARVAADDDLLRLRGRARAILGAERTALNLLCRLSGIATLTARYVAALEGTRARLLDTRKTTPGLRLLEKYAVVCGGGVNHRFGLHDMAMLKENHVAAAGGIEEAVRAARSSLPMGTALELEVRDLEELRIAMGLPVDRVLLDNFGLADLARAVELAGGVVPLEASGGVTLENVAEVGATGVDYVSVGALTHSAPALDLSLLLDPPAEWGGAEP